MKIRMARRMEFLLASEIREILKVAVRPEVISLAGGLPAPEFFPLEELKVVRARLFETEGSASMQYSTTEGYFPLRKWICERMNSKTGTSTVADDILITNGAQQAIDLSGKLFLNEGDAVLCESPSYTGAINSFRVYQPRFIEIKTDAEGMIISDLQYRLETTDRIGLIYVNPDFQNPSGRTWSLSRRQQFMELLSRYSIPVIEDCPYREIRFVGEALPSLKSMDQQGTVVHLGTFSKIFCPGFRVGWVAADRSIIEKYILVKQHADLHTSTIGQMEIATYLSMYNIDTNLEKIRKTYMSRRNAMIKALEKEFPEETQFTRPDGGLFVWVELPGKIDSHELLRRCIESNVAFVPGSSFFPNGGHANTLRLNYSNMKEELIEEGIFRIAKVLKRVQSS
jgi:2-aminoadipate transaminase